MHAMVSVFISVYASLGTLVRRRMAATDSRFSATLSLPVTALLCHQLRTMQSRSILDNATRPL